MHTIEVRCPIGPRRLLSKLLVTGQKPKTVEGNLIEFSCSDCTKVRRKTYPNTLRVLHRFDLAGELVESVEVMRGEE